MNATLNKANYSLYSSEELLKGENLLKTLSEENDLVFIKNINSNEIALQLANKVGCIEYCIDSAPDGITTISNKQTIKNDKNSLAFTQAGLYPHTDRSPIASPPKFLLNWAAQPAKRGGNILLCDATKVHEHLKKYHPITCDRLFETDIAEFSDSIHTHKGAIFQIINGKLSIRFRRDNCVIFREGIQNDIHTLYEAIDLYTFSIPANLGCGYLVDNTRWLHGRTTYKGDRIVKRIQIQEK